MKIEDFEGRFRSALKKLYRSTPEKAEGYMLHNALSFIIMDEIGDIWQQSAEKTFSARRACYFSMEFLMGRAISNNLLCLGLHNQAEEMLSALGRTLSEAEDFEDAALGNGGLGRLAACFLDSAASMSLPLTGYGIRYKYGLFKQGISDGFQTEAPDDWTKHGDFWSIRREDLAVSVSYADMIVRAVPYDMPIIGFGGDFIGTLRLWQSESEKPFNFECFNAMKYTEASAAQIAAEDISRVLYPNDDGEEGKRLRLRQQYFFCAASLADILANHKDKHGDISSLANFVSIQLNDTHPVISIPELIRLLINEGMSFESAFETASKVFCYTNHTVMPEALEKWDFTLIKELLPEIAAIILQINERLLAEISASETDEVHIEKLKILSEGILHMANLAVYCSAHTNGVAKLHTEILKSSVLSDWYQLYPKRFLNQTNGITQRRWLALCNPKLTDFLSELSGSDAFLTDLKKLEGLKKCADDEQAIRRFNEIKHANKCRLSQYILEKEHISVSPDMIFDIQIKRLHEYKRQLMNALSILYIYFGIKDGSIADFTPTAFIFGAKSAPGYRRAKGIIKLINAVSALIQADAEVSELIKVVFVSNYNVSYAEKLIPACDISEQISTAGTEASGTGNMKLMLNGAVTLGTLDGANVEIAEASGEENNYIFGAKLEELEKILPEYSPRRLIAGNEKLRRMVMALIDGTLSDGATGMFEELYLSLMDGASWHTPDNYYVLGDMEAYVRAKLRANLDYRNRLTFGRKCFINTCSAGIFSSDRTIAGYASEIWDIRRV